MTKDLFIGAILRPNETISALVKKYDKSEDWKPGIRFTFYAHLAIAALFAAFAWALLGILLAVSGLATGKLGFFAAPLVHLFAENLSPLSLIGRFAVELAKSIAGSIVFALLLDLLFQRLYQHKGGKSRQAYNVFVAATIPWAVFIVIPVLGWIAAIVGSIANMVRVVRALYQEKDPVKIAVPILLAGIGGAISASILAGVLSAGVRPLRALDPMGPFVSGLADQAVYGKAMSEEDRLKAALNATMEMAMASQQPKAETAPPVPTAVPQAALPPAQPAPKEKPASHHYVAKKTQGDPKPAAEASQASPKESAPAQAAAAPAPTAEPTPEPKNAAVDEAKEAAKSEAIKAGSEAAKNALKSFFH